MTILEYFYFILFFIVWLPVLLIFVSEKPPWGVDDKICIVLYCMEGRRWSMDISWNYTVRLNTYNEFKLSRKFRVNTLHIYEDRPPPSFFLFFFSFFFLLRTLDDSVLNLPRPSVKQCRYLFLKLTSLLCYFSTLKYPQFLLRLGR